MLFFNFSKLTSWCFRDEFLLPLHTCTTRTFVSWSSSDHFIYLVWKQLKNQTNYLRKLQVIFPKQLLVWKWSRPKRRGSAGVQDWWKVTTKLRVVNFEIFKITFDSWSAPITPGYVFLGQHNGKSKCTILSVEYSIQYSWLPSAWYKGIKICTGCSYE